MDASNLNIIDLSGTTSHQSIIENIINQFTNTTTDSSENNLIMNIPYNLPPLIATGSNLLAPILGINPPISVMHTQPLMVRTGRNNIYSQPMTNIMTQSLDEKAKYKHVISPEGLKEIKFDTYTTNKIKNSVSLVARSFLK